MHSVIRYEDLSRNQFSWLDARHHFSFGRYIDRKRMGFANLRVVNDDIVKAGAGFDTHPHDNMEIITYVRKGAITHKDSMGNEGRTAAGDVQVMSAGTGVFHSEYNLESEDTNLYQIWILPNEQGVKPRWDMREFPKQDNQEDLSLLVSGERADEKKGALFIHGDAQIYGGVLAKGKQITHQFNGRPGYILVSDGHVEIAGEDLFKGDAIALPEAKDIKIDFKETSEILALHLSPLE